MTGKGYSAGAIFLEVIPVFKNVQNDTKKFAEDINRNLSDEMEKGGRQAGRKAGKGIADGINEEMEGAGRKGADAYAGHFQTSIKSAVRGVQRELDSIKFDTIGEKGEKTFARIQQLAKDLDVEIKPDMNDKQVLAKLEFLKAELASLQKNQTTLHVFANLDKVYADVAKAAAYMDAEAKKKREFEFGAKFEPKMAERSLGEFEKRARESFKKAARSLGDSMDPKIKEVRAKLEGLADSDFDIDVSTAEARAKITELSVQLREMSQGSTDIDVKVNAGKAAAELAAIRELVGRLDGKDVDIQVESDGVEALIARLSGGSAGLDVFRAKGDAASSTFRSLNPLIATLALLLPAIGPAGAAAAGGIAAIGPAAAVAGTGIGLLILGLSGVSDAVKALSAQQQTAAKTDNTAAKTMTNAADSVRSAEESLADARRNAARAEEDAARAVADAKRNAARSIKSALDSQKQAQQDYADSVKSVKQAEQDLADARKQAQQDQRDLQNQIADNSIAIRQALIDEFKAQTALNAAKADGSTTPVELDQAQITYDQAAQSIKELRDKQKELQAQQANGGNAIGQHPVQDAKDALSAALEKQKKNYEDLGKAAAKVDQARADGARAVAAALRNQSRSQADSAEAIKKAQEALSSAKAGLAQAAIDTGEMAAANQKVEQTMSALGPAGQKFARFLFSLQKPFQEFRSHIESAILPPLQRAMEDFFSKYGPRADRFLTTMARGVGRLITAFSKSLDGPAWQGFFKVMERFGPSIQRSLGGTTISLLESFVSFMTAVTPFTDLFAKALARVTAAFADWSASKEGQKAITDFMQYATDNGPAIIGLFTSLAKALGAIIVAAAPLGGKVISVLTDFFNFIASIPDSTLAALVQGIISLVLAIQAAAVVGTIILSISAAFASVLQMVVAMTVLSVFHFESMRDAIQSLTKWIYNNREALAKLVKVLAIGYLSFRAIRGAVAAYNGIMGIARGVQVGFALATGRATTATKVNVAAVKIAQALTKTWMGITRALTLATLAQNAALLANPYVLIAVAIVALVAVLIYLFKHNKTVHDAIMKAWGALKAVGEAVFGALGKVIGVFWRIFKTAGKVIWTVWVDTIKVVLVLMLAAFKVAWLGIKALWDKVLHPIFNKIGDVFQWLWNKIAKPILGWIGDKFESLGGRIKKTWDNTLGPIFNTIIPPVLKALKEAFKTAIDFIGDKWDNLKKIFAAPIKFVVDTVLNDGLFSAINKLAGWVGVDSLKIDKIKLPAAIENAYATGGVLPGYTPGRDVHDFYSPTAGRLHLSGGEAIMRPEFTRAVGTGFVDQMNALARSGGVGAVRRALGGQAYASGGVYNPDEEVFINGMGISRIAAAQVALAKKLFGIPIYMMQGGFGGNGVAASGTSHNYPGVGDFGPGSIALETALRKVGFAAWARNVPGRSSVGSGAHVHAVSLLDPGDAGSPQVYGSWANYGNGLSGYGNDPAPHPSWVPGLVDTIKAMGIGEITTLVGAGASHNALSGISHLKKVLDIVKGPFEWVKNQVMGPIDSIKEKVDGSALYQAAVGVPKKVVKAVTDKVWDLIPGPVKTAAGWAGDAVGWTVGGVKAAGHAVKEGAEAVGHAASGVGHAIGSGLHALGFADGGILPYNGTMKYDNGGYLPPGLTSVVNLTGRPEPVFTSDQWSRVESEKGGGDINYSPTFVGSDLTAGDIAEDLNFAFRAMQRQGKYGRN